MGDDTSTNSIALIRRLREHQRWAARRLMDAARPLSDEARNQPFEIGMGSLWNTLVHLYAAEFIWLAALEGDTNPVGPREVKFDRFDDLETAWATLAARWDRFVDALSPKDLSKPVTKVSTSSGAGQTFTTPTMDILLHLATHAAHTSAQALNMLRHLGANVPDLQFITLSRGR